MASVIEHYASCLAPVYTWAEGGMEAALARGAGDVAPLGPAPPDGAVAVDLGAGAGAHAVPLARSGFRVIAIDQSAHLLGELRRHAAGLDVRAVQADLVDFRAHLDARPNVIVCMGDTLTHLTDVALVLRLFDEVADALADGGRFLATFRDSTALPEGDARFIPVRSDPERIHTCFLEARRRHVLVHDIVHQRQGARWRMRVSHYRKLRLSPRWVARMLERVGLTTVVEGGARGMVRVTATRPPGRSPGSPGFSPGPGQPVARTGSRSAG